MVEIILIILCINAAGRFRKAGESGVGKYIAGVWGSLLGCVILGGVIGGSTQSVGTLYVFSIIGYIIALIIAISAMKTGKSYMEFAAEQRQRALERENAEKAIEQEKQIMATSKLSETVANLEAKLAALELENKKITQGDGSPDYPRRNG